MSSISSKQSFCFLLTLDHLNHVFRITPLDSLWISVTFFRSNHRLKISQFSVMVNHLCAIQVKGGIFQQLQRLPDACPPGLDDDHLRSLNQLREFWHNSRGAVFIDDQVE